MTAKEAYKRLDKLETVMGIGGRVLLRVFYDGCPKVISVLEMRNGQHPRTLPKDDPAYQLTDTEIEKISKINEDALG